jgi:hypothetical protein
MHRISIACLGRLRAGAGSCARYGVDVLRDDFDLQAWRDLLGEYLTMLLRELRAELERRELADRRLGVGVARGDVLGPPLSNTTLHWRDWIRSGLVDHLIVNQNSSQCSVDVASTLADASRRGIRPELSRRAWPSTAIRPSAHCVRTRVDGTRTQLFVARQ